MPEDGAAQGDAWVGAVLTGGASRRMGRDKATLEVDGVGMADRVAAALEAAGATAVARIGGAVGDVPDLHPGAGPLGGVLTALAWSEAPVVVVAPCDLLAPDPRSFAALVAALGAAPSVLAAVAARDRPLPVALRTAAAGPLADAFAAGERAVHRALRTVPLVVVDLAAAAVADADTPADLPPGGR